MLSSIGCHDLEIDNVESSSIDCLPIEVLVIQLVLLTKSDDHFFTFLASLVTLQDGFCFCFGFGRGSLSPDQLFLKVDEGTNMSKGQTDSLTLKSQLFSQLLTIGSLVSSNAMQPIRICNFSEDKKTIMG